MRALITKNPVIQIFLNHENDTISIGAHHFSFDQITKLAESTGITLNPLFFYHLKAMSQTGAPISEAVLLSAYARSFGSYAFQLSANDFESLFFLIKKIHGTTVWNPSGKLATSGMMDYLLTFADQNPQLAKDFCFSLVVKERLPLLSAAHLDVMPTMDHVLKIPRAAAMWAAIVAVTQSRLSEMTVTGYWVSNLVTTYATSRKIPMYGTHHLPLYRPVLSCFNHEGVLALTAQELHTILKTGFFQVTVPDALMPSIHIILKFLTAFSSEEKYTTGFNHDHPDVVAVPIQGFMIDSKKPLPGERVQTRLNQVQRLNLKQGPEHDFWSYFPSEVQEALKHYKAFKMRVFNDLLNKMGIEPALHAELTCGVSKGLGDEYALFNDFSCEGIKAEFGLKQHKDYGMLTALLSPVYRRPEEARGRSGLEVFIDLTGQSQWYSVVPAEKAIIFNFGSALEKALQHFSITFGGLPPVTLQAAVHRVALTATRRFSFANFGDPAFSASIHSLWETDGKQTLRMREPYSAHCMEENKKLYEY